MWDLTLRQIEALGERHEAHERAQDRRAGEMVAMLYNVHRDQKKDPKGATWLTFFPEHRDETVQSDEEMLNAMMLWARTTVKERA